MLEADPTGDLRDLQEEEIDLGFAGSEVGCPHAPGSYTSVKTMRGIGHKSVL